MNIIIGQYLKEAFQNDTISYKSFLDVWDTAKYQNQIASITNKNKHAMQFFGKKTRGCMIFHLPEDILEHVFYFCPSNICMNSSKTCTLLRKMSLRELKSRLIVKICYENTNILDVYTTPEYENKDVQSVKKAPFVQGGSCKQMNMFTRHCVPYLDKFYIKNPVISNVQIVHFCTAQHGIKKKCKKPGSIRIDYDDNKVIMIRLCANGLIVCVRYQAR